MPMCTLQEAVKRIQCKWPMKAIIVHLAHQLEVKNFSKPATAFIQAGRGITVIDSSIYLSANNMSSQVSVSAFLTC